jgi:hypothetical protein
MKHWIAVDTTPNRAWASKTSRLCGSAPLRQNYPREDAKTQSRKDGVHRSGWYKYLPLVSEAIDSATFKNARAA